MWRVKGASRRTSATKRDDGRERQMNVKTVVCAAIVASASVIPAAQGETALPKVVGYQLDVSRCKVPTMRTLHRMIDLLATLGYNQFQLYTEHTFAYSQHETVWREASPMTPSEIRELDAYCAERGIELVPNQNSFGHLEHWLRHPGYNDLAEMPAGGAVYKRWGDYVSKFPMALCPTDSRSVDFLAGLYDELFPCFRSKYVNVGCDETVELWDAEGKGRSQAAIKEKGAPRVYLDFLLKIHRLCAARGHRMMFWGDIILHNPELIPELPEDVVCLNWGYEANHPFAKQTAAFKAAKREFVVCPGTSAWGSLSGRINNMMANIDSAVTNGLQNGMRGILIADWGDGGHPNPWVTSVPAIVYAAHRLRGEQLTRDQLAAELDKVLGCSCGRALIAYGDIYEKAKGRMGNSTELYYLLKQGKDYKRAAGVTDETLAAALRQWKFAESLLDLEGAPQWVREDFAVLNLVYRAVEMRIKAPDKKNFRAMFEPEYRRLWLSQNRVGGLALSLTSLFGPQ